MSPPPAAEPAGSFTRAADYYDATRALPPAVGERVTGLLAAELAGRRTCLEIGAGTGRIALPLHQHGVDLVGLDLAPAMLERIARKAGGEAPFPLIVGDATRLPLADSSCGAVLACHVLHLIPAWRAAVDEALRVLAPGGVLLVDFGGRVIAPWQEPVARVAAAYGVSATRPGATDPAEVAGYLAGRAAVRELPPVPFPVTVTLAEDLRTCEQQIFSWTWDYPPEQLEAVCDGVRRWAADTGMDLDRPVTLTRTIRWLAYEPASPPA